MLGKINAKLSQWEQETHTFRFKKYHLIPVIVPILFVLSIPIFLFMAHDKTNSVIGAQAAAKPDVVVVMVDDLGYISGDERILNKLPNIKALFLDNGLKFTNYYDETPLCCPGRASFLTGQHTKNHHVTRLDARLLDPTNTIATALHQDGYYTIAAGKYLNGADKLADKTPPGWDKIAMALSWNSNISSNWAVQGNSVTAGFTDRYTADKSLTWLQNAPKSQPIFMWLTPHAPHYADGHQGNPWAVDVEKKYINDPRCNNVAAWDPPTYSNSKKPNGYPLNDVCRSLLTTDDMIGALRAEFAKQGRNPIWIFTSDNGMSWGRDGFPLKNVPQSTALPLYFSGPGIPHGVTGALTSNIDLGPTIAAMAGTVMPKADGASFANVVRTNAACFRSWLLEDHPEGGTTGSTPTETGPWWGIRTSNYHLVEWPKSKFGPEALFDVVNDPWETKNIAQSNPSALTTVKNIMNTNYLLGSNCSNPISTTPNLTLTPTVTPNPSVTPTPTNNAVFVSQSLPTTMTTGQTYSVSVTMKNNGTKTWTGAAPTPYRLGSQNPQDNKIWGTGRISLPSTISVAPGGQYTFTFNITAPATAGLYNFQWKMVQETVGWFGGVSSNEVVDVNAPVPPPSEGTVINDD